ncbi:hypothetical protein SAMN05444398_1084 [Roseovarius pacificus]|uniref:Uncharacterized protein n=1 Tax=Roseovarius pacificus TaxID=337701 RepID=A0A1M7EYJ7_9RHOB|nr:hypothetical protein [Roseovarius pacificus]GGO58627.1 hypothetical protein GCM10011315_28630 [Roseovarius pacificus]SHL96803.1 hypothetical protein SAMN05444398_1084 [Roseovarius pacificus]
MSKHPKHVSVAEPTLIISNALHVGATYRVAADRLNADGYLPDDDFRLARDVQDIDRRLPDFNAAYLRDCHGHVMALRDELSPLGRSETQTLTSLLAVHGKLVNAAGQGPLNQFEGLGGLAIVEEDIALLFKKTGTERAGAAARAVIAYAANACDTAVLSRRHQEFDGLAGPVAARSGLSFTRVVHDLWRHGSIKDDDPRRKLDPSRVKSHPLFDAPSGQFLEEASASMRDIMPELTGARDHPIWGRAIIENDIGEFQAAAEQMRTRTNSGQKVQTKVHARVMMALASMIERAGLNVSQLAPASGATASLFAICASASARSHVYQKRAREQASPTRQSSARH